VPAGYLRGMRPHRLQRLKLLTQGAALLGLGSVEACQQREPVHINAPFSVSDAGTDAASTTAAPPAPPPDPPHINAPYVPPDAGAASTSAAGAAAVGTSEPPAKVRRPKLIINAPPKHISPPDKVLE